MPDKIMNSEFYAYLLKIIFPAFLAVGVKIAIEVKKNKTRVSFMNVILSMIIGVGSAHLSSDYVLTTFEQSKVSMVIAVIAITSEKIGEFLIYKFNVDAFLTAICEGFLEYIVRVFSNKKND